MPYNIQPEVWSEHGELEIVFLCAPPIINISHSQTLEDVRWDSKVSHEKAYENFEAFKEVFRDAGVQIIDYAEHLSPEDLKLSDQLINRHFVRDLACVMGNTILPGEAGTFARRPEYLHAHLLMKDWFPEEKFLIHENDDLKALECGDIMPLNRNIVLINIGLRTSLESVIKIKERIYEAGFSEIALISLPRRMDTLHLDMALNVANPDLIVAKHFIQHLPVQVLTEKESRYEMSGEFFKRHGFEAHWLEKYDTVPDINFIHLDPETLLMSKHANHKMLKSHPKMKNKRIVEVDVSELEKTGGGIRCMTLPLRRKDC
ncbi:arginine deiminase family protein [Aciduricibacillus chroicocephali]|uniref:Arginine deiminase family protein n=1 Tax=Aciduricibacillus chroicocephali TaxID=3054939 RepID=A0ABY9KV06_9BACI|nr:arginine deiminase family protein [Bacillaceae bacterium 44XB]